MAHSCSLMPETPPTLTSSLRGRRPRTRMSRAQCCPRPCRNSLKAGPITDRSLASAMRVAASRTRHLAVFQSERLKWSLHPFRPYGTGRSRPRQDRRRGFPLPLSLHPSISSTYLLMCLQGMVLLAQGVWLFSWDAVSEELSRCFVCIAIQRHLSRQAPQRFFLARIQSLFIAHLCIPLA